MPSTTSRVPRVVTTTPASPSAPHAALTTPASTSVPCVALMTSPAASSIVPVLPPTAQPVPHVLPAGAVPISSVVHLHLMQTRGAVGFRQPKLYIITTLSPIPKLVWVTLDDPQWRAAMAEEYATLMSNNTWDLVPRPRDANVVIDMWKFKHKFNDDKTLERYKAHRVLHGFMQRPNVDL
jgi:hypothetical protein